MKLALHVALGLALVATTAAASPYTDAQAKAFDDAAEYEVHDHDPAGEAMYRALAEQARSGRAVTLADLPAAWRDDVRSGRRDTHESVDYVWLVRMEKLLDALSDSVRLSNVERVAHAEVDTFRARRELSEPRPWKTCAAEFLHHAQADLAGLTAGDRDGDGILDSVDKCPDVPEDFDGFEDADGCPDLDNDRDGIPDASDRCPNEPEDKDGFQDADGCPDPDNDGDGILDANDKCPNDPETMNGIADDDGCPDGFKAVHFDSDSSRLDAEAIAALGSNAELLNASPGLRIRIEGNADWENSDDYNYRLGHRRAQSVKDYLVGYLGISAARLETESNGEKLPVASNVTPEGRRMNRRADFVVVAQ
jgi:outer membrane protein OmpA-like peptidoglycan-associated protein